MFGLEVVPVYVPVWAWFEYCECGEFCYALESFRMSCWNYLSDVLVVQHLEEDYRVC